MSQSYDEQRIEQIHSSGKQLWLACTGGGSGAIGALLAVPGASASVVGAIVPYAQAALADWLGCSVEQACSERTARAMAMRAFETARKFATVDDAHVRGMGVTASLASNRPKRGAHRMHVAWQSAEMTVAVSSELEKGRRTRAEEEQVVTRLVLDAVAEAVGVQQAPQPPSEVCTDITRRERRAEPAWSELLLGRRAAVEIGTAGTSPTATRAVLFPGAFNPLHEGHRRMAAVAAERLGKPVSFELSIANVDKPPLDFLEIGDRLASLSPQPVLLTRAATFVEKARLAPGCVFVVGTDTLERIGDVRYYGGDAAARDAAIAAIAGEGCRFLVFGRNDGERFRTLADVALPAALGALCDEVREMEFRADISSTQIRGRE